ncbi:MAG: hypothetical protein ACYST0_07575 [Planctomycetota bacterium]|jgi:hypothetical protein
MQKLTVTGLVLVLGVPVLGVPVLAQGTTTSPAGYLTTAGSSYSYYLGRYSNGRYQMADGELKGKTLAMTRFDFRLDNRSYGTTTGMGRSWTRVTLDMAETDVADMTNAWDDNILTTPTRVFDSKMTWTTVTGRPSSTPWGHVSFPFTKTWVYTGKNDMLAEYLFYGGTLANSGRWTGGNNSYYYLDSIPNQDAISGSGTYMPTSSNNCNDSALSSTTGAYTYGYATAFHVNYTTHTYRDKLRLYWYSYYTAPAKSVIHAFGVGRGNTAGIDIGARCHRLYLDATLPFVLTTRRAASTTSAYSGANQGIIPWENRWQGQTFHVQGAWADSSTGLFSLTRGRSFVVPSYPTQTLQKRTLFHYTPTASSGIGPYSTTTSLSLPRITYR